MPKKQIHQRKLIANAVREEMAAMNQNSDLLRSRFNFVGSSNLGFELTGGYHAADAKRNIWQAAGYPDQIEFDNLWNMVERNGLAYAALHLPVNKTWQNFPTVTDGQKEEGDKSQTQFEKDLDILINKHKLWHRLRALDKRQSYGRYGGIVLIVKEFTQQNPTEEINPIGGINALVKLVPAYESQIIVNPSHIISDVTDPMYGNPTQYEFKSYVAGSRSPLDQNSRRNLHHSRVYAWGEDADDGTIFGVPALLASFNALLDYEKIRASMAEGYFKNAKQRFTLNVNDKQIASTMLQGDRKEAFDKQIDDFSTGIDTSLLLSGMEAKQLQSTMHDPQNPLMACVNEIGSSRGIPATILIGQQTGRLASDEDQSHFAQNMNARRELEANEMIRGFFDHLIKYKLITPPENEIVIEWQDLTEPSASDKLDLADKMTKINKSEFDAGATEPTFGTEEIRETAGFEKQRETNDDLREYTGEVDAEDDESQS